MNFQSLIHILSFKEIYFYFAAILYIISNFVNHHITSHHHEAIINLDLLLINFMHFFDKQLNVYLNVT